MDPLILRPAAIQAVFDTYPGQATPLLDTYFPLVGNRYPGPSARYDILTDDRERPRVNTRGGPALYVNADGFQTVTIHGETWRDARRITATTLQDLRRPGTANERRGEWQIVHDTALLRNRWNRFLEWLASCGLVGTKTFYPLGLDESIEELLLTDTTNIVATPTAPWNAASASEAAARTNLANIRTDFGLGIAAIANAGGECSEVVLNDVTLGMLDTQFLAAGYDASSDVVLLEGHVQRMFGLDLKPKNATYIHPITGAVTKYIADNVAIFLDGDNERTGRQMMECEPLDIHAPAGETGVYLGSLTNDEPPGERVVYGTWTGQPVLVWPRRMYVLTDITAS